MHTLIMCLAEVQDVAKISPVKENFKKILGAVLWGSSFIQIYLRKHRLRKSPVFLIPLAIVANFLTEQIADAQFRSELDGLKLEFCSLRDDFKDVIASQIAIDVGMSPRPNTP